MKGVFARFQKLEFASGLVATPRSPIPPALASGEILRNGTAVVTTFIGLASVCALRVDIPAKRNDAATNRMVFLFILLIYPHFQRLPTVNIVQRNRLCHRNLSG